MPITTTRRALAAAAVAVFALAGAACGDDDDDAASDADTADTTTTTGASDDGVADQGSAAGGGATRFNPDTDDPLVSLCDGYFSYVAEGNLDGLLDVNLAADVIGDLDEVRDASFFLYENPDPSDADTQSQAEDALAILRTDIEESGLCDDVEGEGDGEETGDGEPTEGDLALAMCDEWANFNTSGDTTSLDVILRNADDIGLSQEGVDAVGYLLDDPDGSVDQEQHEAAVSLGDDAFFELCG